MIGSLPDVRQIGRRGYATMTMDFATAGGRFKYIIILTGANLKLGRSSGWVGRWRPRSESERSRTWWQRIDFSVVWFHLRKHCARKTRYSDTEKLEKGGTSALKRGRRRVVRLNHFGESRVALLFALRAIFFQIPVTLVKGL